METFKGLFPLTFDIHNYSHLQCIGQVLKRKQVVFPMKKEWYNQIKDGVKHYELRAASKHWLPRIKGAYWAVFTLGHLIKLRFCFTILNLFGSKE